MILARLTAFYVSDGESAQLEISLACFLIAGFLIFIRFIGGGGGTTAGDSKVSRVMLLVKRGYFETKKCCIH